MNTRRCSANARSSINEFRLALLVFVALFALLGVSALHAQAIPTSVPIAAGGGYTLLQLQAPAHAGAQVAPELGVAEIASATGGAYQLLAPASMEGTGTPCCCMYMPCVKK